MTGFTRKLTSSVEIRLTAAQSRALALSLSAIPCLVVLWIVVGAFLAMQEHHARLGLLKQDQATYEALIADLPQRKMTIEEIRRSGVENAFYAPASAQEFGRQLQMSVGQLLSVAHVTATESTVRIEADDAPVVRASEHVAFVTDIATLTQILYRLALARPVLTVDHVAITDLAGEARERGPHALAVDLVVTGYRRPQS